MVRQTGFVHTGRQFLPALDHLCCYLDQDLADSQTGEQVVDESLSELCPHHDALRRRVLGPVLVDGDVQHLVLDRKPSYAGFYQHDRICHFRGRVQFYRIYCCQTEAAERERRRDMPCNHKFARI